MKEKSQGCIWVVFYWPAYFMAMGWHTVKSALRSAFEDAVDDSVF